MTTYDDVYLDVANAMESLERAARKWRKLCRLKLTSLVPALMDAQEVAHLGAGPESALLSLKRAAIARRAALAQRLLERLRQATRLRSPQTDWRGMLQEAAELLGSPERNSARDPLPDRAKRRATPAVRPTAALYAPLLAPLPLSPPTPPVGRGWVFFGPGETYAPEDLYGLGEDAAEAVARAAEQAPDVLVAVRTPWSLLPASGPCPEAYSALRARSTQAELDAARRYDTEQALLAPVDPL